MKSMHENINRRIAVAMSGGVDSSAAALILKQQGYDVIGMSMKLWEGGEGGKGRCCSLEDFEDARRVAAKLEIPYYVVNMQEAFADRVIRNFVDSYLEGKTPNPCTLCNQEMKFDILLKKAAELGASHLATGHYAAIDHDDVADRYVLKKGKDPEKDQTYFLFSMTQKQMEHIMFPIGNMEKEDVRRMLRDGGIAIADKHESQDICFVDGDSAGYASFVERWAGANGIRKGRIVSIDGTVLGKHDGIHQFTIGQRRGLGISSSQRLYVIGFDHEKNDVVVGSEDRLYSKGLFAGKINWLSISAPAENFRASVKIRYSLDEESAIVSPLNDGSVRVDFDAPQRAVTPGQAVVFYDGNKVLGGGWIERVLS